MTAATTTKEPDASGRARRIPTVVLAALVPIIAVVAVVVTLSATSESGVTGGATGGSTVGNAVTIKDFAFSPTPLAVRTGATISVSNADGTAHTLTANNNSFDTGNLDGGAKGTITVDAPGRYAYHCEIHNYMTGVIEAR
jgi:plastocyanin